MFNMNHKSRWIAALLLSPSLTFAQGQILQGQTVFSNALFITLLAIIIFLLIVAIALTQVLKNLAKSDLFLRLREKTNSTSSKLTGVIVFCLLANVASAENQGASAGWIVGGLEMSTFIFMVAVIALELIFITSLFRTMKSLLRDPNAKKEVKVAVKKEKSILEKLNASVEIEREEEIMTNHDYDGIRELDNDLPPWWRYGFYLTIVVSVVYLIHYHVTNTGDLQLAEYEKEVAQGKAEVEAYMKNAAANVDENSVTMMSGADLEQGKTLFISNCAACHGRAGEGGVGPNLTDEYWLHSGSLADVFKSIKYGWPDKGMKAWKEDLSPVQIAQISSFIRSLKGTNPPNGKAQQGDLYTENKSDAGPADSLSIKPELKADTLLQK